MSIIYLLMSLSMAEGYLVNKSNQDLYCYYNIHGYKCLAKVLIKPGEYCEGDAMGTERYVYKIPDTAKYYCYGSSCSPASPYSYAVMRYGIYKKGREHYGEMSMQHFMDIMYKFTFCPNEIIELDRAGGVAQ